MAKTMTQQQVYQYLNELELRDQTIAGNRTLSPDEEVNLTGLGERVLDEFDVAVNDPQENDVFEWVFLWSTKKGYSG